MSNRNFFAIMIAIVVVVLAMIYVHRPRSGSSARSLPLHGGR